MGISYFFSCGRGNTSEMSANACFSMRNKIKPKKKKRKRNEATVTEKREEKKKNRNNISLSPSLPFFFKIIIAAFDEKRLGSIVATRAQLQNGAKNFVRIFPTLVCKFSLLLTGFCLCSLTLALFVV